MLLENGGDYCDRLRRKATANRRSLTPVVCDMCGWPVYVSKNGFTREYFFAHFKGAHPDCPWFTGNNLTVNQASALQFQGVQESPLHHYIKNAMGDILREFDVRASDVVVDEYLITESGRRRPDVRATYDGKPVAFEIQLSSTQLPIILDREEFYAEQQRWLFWVTWNLQPVAKSRLPQAFRDIALSHNGNVFSVDKETLAVSRETGALAIRVTWWIEDSPHQEIVTLDQLYWPENGLPYYMEIPKPWHVAFQDRWVQATQGSTLKWDIRRQFWQEIIDRLELDITPQAIDFDHEALEALISLLMSLQQNRPVGSKESNLTQMLNTFLNTSARRPFAALVVHFAKRVGQLQLFERESTRKKLEDALKEKHEPFRCLEASIVAEIFPNLMHGGIN
jgi:Family of unknown function (DUF6035)